jgi:hypothetical protein
MPFPFTPIITLTMRVQTVTFLDNSFSTEERRIRALSEMIRVLKPGLTV